MNISVLGASGRVGSVILDNLSGGHHSVRALVRDPQKLKKVPKGLSIVKGNATDDAHVFEALEEADAVISALNTDKSTTLSISMPIIIKNMKKQGVNRIITIGTAGILQARSEPKLYRFQTAESKRTTTRDAEEHLKAYLVLKDSGLDWTIVCPTYLPIGERVGHYRYEKDFLPENPSSISIFDTADFACEQLFSNEMIGCRVGITY